MCLYNLSRSPYKWKTHVSVSFYIWIDWMGDREMGRDVKANTKRVRHCLNEAQKKIFSLKVVRKQVSRLFQSLCRPSSSSHFIWLKMLMKVDETALNTKWWKSKNKKTGSGGSDRKEKKSRPWANEHYYYKEWHAWGPLKDLCNRINCTCHVASVTLLKMLRGKISTCLEVNSVETSDVLHSYVKSTLQN